MKCLKLELLNKLEAKGKFVNLNPLTKQQRKSLDIRKSLMITLDPLDLVRIGGDIIHSEKTMRTLQLPSNDFVVSINTLLYGKSEPMLFHVIVNDGATDIAVFARVGGSNYNLLSIFRLNMDESDTSRDVELIFPRELGKIDEDADAWMDVMRYMVIGLLTKFEQNSYSIKAVNPNIIYDPKLRSMSKSDKLTYIDHTLVDKVDTIEVEESPIDVTKVTSRKLALMKHIEVPKPGKGWVNTKGIINIAGDLTPSILFSDIRLDPLTFDDAQNISFEQLPFEDFMTLSMLGDMENGVETDVIDDALMIRYKRINSEVYLFIYTMNDKNKNYALVLIEKIDPADGSISPVFYFDIDLRDRALTQFLPTVKHILYTITSFEPKVSNDPRNSYNVRKKVPATKRDLFIEYTLDKSKAIRYTNHESKGGTHKSPIEHERIGHWRTYKSGKRTWVNGMTVNKGKGGRVNKDYKI